MTDTKELIVIKPAQLAEVFVENGLDPFIELIKKEVEGIAPDLSTKKGRDAIKSRAYWVAQKKALIDNAGKKYVAELKSKIKPIDKERKRMRDILESLQAEIKQPLTEWEAEEDRKKKAEAERIEAIQDRIQVIRDFSPFTEKGIRPPLLTASSKQLQEGIDNLSELIINDSYGEFQKEAQEAKNTRFRELENALTFAVEKEEIAAEKQRLADEEKERKRKAREEEIANKAREDERLKAERKAQKERDELKEKETRAKLETERLEREKQETAERVEREKKEAKEKAEKDKADAIEADRLERKRIEDARIAEKERRAKDTEHRLKINTEVYNELNIIIKNDNIAGELLSSLSAGDIPHVSINY